MRPTLLMDLLQEFDVLAQRLVAVLDRDASEELVVETIEQVDEVRPGLVSIESVLVQIGELILERLVEQVAVLAQRTNLTLEILDLRLVVVDDAHGVVDALLELAEFVLLSLIHI